MSDSFIGNLTSVPNLFSTLEHYGHRAPENYLTESLVYLLKLLLARKPVFAAKVLSTMLGIESKFIIEKQDTIVIETQMSTPIGTPDIVIQLDSDYIAYIEAKHDSPLGENQLERYQQHLHSLPTKQKQLVLLCRSRLSYMDTALSADGYRRVCWYQIYNILDSLDYEDEIVAFCATQFQQFLEQKNMSMQQVPWQYMEGVNGLLYITNMMEVAAREMFPVYRIARSAGWNWRGFKLGGKLFFGVRFSDPLKLTIDNQYDKSGAEYEAKYLNLREVHFFSLSKDEQFEAIVEFLRTISDDLSG